MTGKRVYFVVDFTLANLQEFRNSWHGGALAARKKQERIRGFFHFAQANGWEHIKIIPVAAQELRTSDIGRVGDLVIIVVL